MFGILKFFQRREIIELDIPPDKMELIERAAAAHGCSVENFILGAARAQARELTGDRGRSRGFKAFLLDRRKPHLKDPDLVRDKTPMRDVDL